MKKHIIFLFAIILLLMGKANAQQNFDKVDAWLNDNTPAMGGRSVLVVYKDGKVVYNKAVNDLSRRQKMVNKFMARRQNKTANLDDYNSATKIPIASCSKWLSAALVMTFVDEGKLKLTDTVGKYLPILSQHGKGNITLSQCLSHTTGINPPSLKESLQEMRGVSTMDEAIADIANLPMEGKPGTVFHYSNAGLQIAGAIIEKIGGKDFHTLFAERIAAPLEMKNSDFGTSKVALPAGGANSSADDYTNFLVMILNKGVYKGKRILIEKSVTEMQVNRVTADVKIGYGPAEAGTMGYGYGEWIMGPNVVSSPGLFGSFPVVDNKGHYTAILLCYYIKNDGRGERYKQLVALLEDALK